MSAAIHELPLALFTTLASVGAGAFIALCIAFFTCEFEEEQLRRIDKLSLVPAVLVIVGFIAAAFHVANPLAAVGVFAGLGRSPMSNELAVAGLFAVVMVVYVVLALAGKLKAGSRKGLLAVLAVLAVVFAIFMGLAYNIATVQTWSTPWPTVQMLGYALLGGNAVAACVVVFAKALDKVVGGSCKAAWTAMAVAGVVLAVVGLAAMAVQAQGAQNAIVSGAELLSGAVPFIVVSIVCLLAACAIVVAVLRGKESSGLALAAVVIVCVGVLAGRFLFYALQLSVGISL